MIELGREAERQLDDLLNHYDAKGRVEAMRNLRTAIRLAAAFIERSPGRGTAVRHGFLAGNNRIRLRRHDRA